MMKYCILFDRHKENKKRAHSEHYQLNVWLCDLMPYRGGTVQYKWFYNRLYCVKKGLQTGAD